MKYMAIFNSVKQARGIPDKDDARLLADLNMVRHDIVHAAPWRVYVRKTAGAYAQGGFVVPGQLAGIVAVSSDDGRFYYFGDRAFVPANLGFRIWEFHLQGGSEWRVRMYGEDGAEVAGVQYALLHWQFPDDLTLEALSTTDYEFASTAPFISALHGRWLRYAEGRPEEAGAFESLYDRQLAGMISLNPRAALPPPVNRGGTTYFPGYVM